MYQNFYFGISMLIKKKNSYISNYIIDIEKQILMSWSQ